MPQHFLPAQIEQFRRDAKRHAKAGDISLSQALDIIAASHGFARWSQLMRHTEKTPVAVVTAPPSVSEVRESLKLPRMDASREESRLIAEIVKRYATLLAPERTVDRLSVMMDLEACHCNGCALDLVALHEAARDTDVIHDVAGIGRHLDRDTGKLSALFRPRYALQTSST